MNVCQHEVDQRVDQWNAESSFRTLNREEKEKQSNLKRPSPAS